MDQAQFPWRPLGSLLVERGLVTEAELEEGLAEQARTGRLLGEILVRRGFVSGWTLTRALAEQHGVELRTAGEPDERRAPDPGRAAPPAEPSPTWRPLGRLLVETGALTVTQLQDALAEQRRDRRPLGEVLISRGSLSGEALARALATQQGVELEPADGLEAAIRPAGSDEPRYEVRTDGAALYESTNFLEAVDFAFEYVMEHEPGSIEIDQVEHEKRELVWMYSQDRAAKVAAARKDLVDTFGFDPTLWDAGPRHSGR